VRHMWDECDGVVHLIYMSMVYVNMYKSVSFCVCVSRACMFVLADSDHKLCQLRLCMFVPAALQWGSTAVLAITHINTRNGSIVGEETLSRIPHNFKVPEPAFTPHKHT
jgi:hypothetical protein